MAERAWQDTTFALENGSFLSVAELGHSIGLSHPGYANAGGQGFCVKFMPGNLPTLRELISELESLAGEVPPDERQLADLQRQRDYTLQVVRDIQTHLSTEIEPNMAWISEQLEAMRHYCESLSPADRSQDAEQAPHRITPLPRSATEQSSHYRIGVGQMEPEL